MARLKQGMHPLLTDPVIAALFSKNIFTVLNFLECEIKQITFITDLSYKEVLGVRKHLINKSSAVVQNGLNCYLDLIQKSAIIPTGIQNIDTMLNGGLTTGNIYEICGLPASGKTQFCFTLAKNVVSQLDQLIYYIDTKWDFNGKKVLSMLDKDCIPEQNKIGELMSKILVQRISTVYELVNCLYGILNEIRSKTKLRLVIIDSLPPLFYQSMDYARNYGIMNQLANIMHLLVKEYHMVFVVTNVITTWYEGDFVTEKTMIEKLGLGKYWFSIAHTRLMISKRNDASLYDVNIMKSNKLPKGTSCTIKISDLGFL